MSLAQVIFVNPREKFEIKCPKDLSRVAILDFCFTYKVLEKNLKMCQLIGGQGGHFGFRIHLKSNNTWSGHHICAKIGVDPCSRY